MCLLEPQAVFANEIELAAIPIPRTNDLRELRAIHAQLFKGVYAWAGQVRVVDIRKSQTGAEFFLPVGHIERAAGFVFAELHETRALKGCGRDDFVSRLAYFYDQSNALPDSFSRNCMKLVT